MKKILLSLFALLAVMGAKADNEYTLGEELTFEQVKDGQTPFILARVSDGQVLVYGTNGNMAAMKSPTEAGNSQNAFYFRVDAIAGNDTYEANLDEARNAEANAFNGEETNDNLYMFRIYKGTPESLSFWGAWGSTEAFISHCGWTANSNNLNGAKFGADVFYNTIWKVAVEEDGISLQSQSIDNKNYLNGNGGPGEKASWKIYSGLVQGDEIHEDPWVCPEGEIDITTLPWVQNANNCDNRLGTTTDATVWGTDAGPGATPLSYVDLTNCSTLKVYGPKGQRARFFINRDEFPGNFQFYADLNEEGVGVLDLATVLAAQEGAEYIHLNGIKAAQWGQQLRLNGVTVIEAADTKLIANMTITEAGFATFCAPFAVTPWEDVSAGEVKAAYIVSGIDENNQLVLTNVDVIPAYQPVLLEGEAFSEDLEGVDDPDAEWPTGLLQGVVEDTPACAGDYVLQNNDGKVGFYVVAEGTNVKVPANRAFLQVPNMGPGARVQAYFLDAVTALNKLTQSTSKTIYDLNGRQLKKLQKGVNVVNGVKVLVK